MTESAAAGPDVPLGLRLLRIHPAVADTSALIADVKKSVRTGRISPLLMAMQFGTVRIYIAHHVWAEMPRVIAALSAAGKLSDEEATTAERLWWSRYIPLIRVVDAAALPADAVSPILAGRDATDVPTARLAALLAPVPVLATDRDLTAVGLAHEQWRPVADAGAAIAQLAGTVNGGATVVAAVGYGLVAGIGAAVRLMARPNVSPFATVAAIGLVVSSSRWLPTIQRLREGFRERAGKYRSAITDWGQQVGQQMEAAYASWDAAKRGDAGHTSSHLAARMLAQAAAPMFPAEVASQLYPLNSPGRQPPHFQTQIEHALHACSAFVEVTPGVWQLGRESADFGGTPTHSLPSFLEP